MRLALPQHLMTLFCLPPAPNVAAMTDQLSPLQASALSSPWFLRRQAALYPNDSWQLLGVLD